jgi:2,3-bisphosphoglycerate-dependent phosphoglycerate mutase
MLTVSLQDPHELLAPFPVQAQQRCACLRDVSTPETKQTLWFVRHGESTWNASGFVQGQANGPVLTRNGRTEAASITGRLAGATITALYTSDLRRAWETAEIVGRALRIAPQSDVALRERNFGRAQGRPHSTLPPAASGIDIDRVVDADARPVGGESLTELYERVARFIDGSERCAPEGDVLVVTHGGVIRVAQAYCNGLPAAGMDWGPVPNASVWGLTRPQASIAMARQRSRDETVRSV